MTSAPGKEGSVYSENPGIFIKPHGVYPPHEIDQMESPEIMGILRNLDPQGTWDAGHRFAAVGQALNVIATRIAKHGDTLAEHWKGSGGAGAMRTFQEMHDYAARAAAQANQTGEALKWLGNDVMPGYQSLAAPHEMHGVSKTEANHAARMYLKSFSAHVIAANNHIPSRIVGMAPARKATGKTTTIPGQPPASGGPGGGVPAAPVNGPGNPGLPPVTQSSPSASPFAPASPGAQLQGLTGPAAPAAAPVTSAPAPAAPSGGPGLTPVMPPAGGSALDSTLPAAGRAADNAAADGAAGTAGEATGAEAARAAGAEGEGINAMPMMGGAGGQSEQDRQRQAWMNEDQDIWGVPADDGTPPLLG